MALKQTFKIIAATAFLGLAGCASTASMPPQDAMIKVDSTEDLSNKLSPTENVVKSADGEMVCKRQSVVGSNFKRKICATQAEWDARSEADRAATSEIQRSGVGTGNGN